MPIYDINTVTAGELVTVEKMNEEWQGNISHLLNPPACRVYNNANISCGDAATVQVTFNSERYDTDGMHSTSVDTGRITIKTAGLYLITFHGAFVASSDYNYVSAHIRLNSSTILARQSKQHNVISADPAISLSTVYKFAVAEWIDVAVYQDNTSAAARNLSAIGNYTPEFSATWIGRA